ncbi:MAG: hypothetical protein HQL52_19375 [Magnetococcales bacterium]|nr:hypothetical protein [Magnetococcales bacterium]
MMNHKQQRLTQLFFLLLALLLFPFQEAQSEPDQFCLRADSNAEAIIKPCIRFPVAHENAKYFIAFCKTDEKEEWRDFGLFKKSNLIPINEPECQKRSSISPVSMGPKPHNIPDLESDCFCVFDYTLNNKTSQCRWCPLSSLEDLPRIKCFNPDDNEYKSFYSDIWAERDRLILVGKGDPYCAPCWRRKSKLGDEWVRGD